MTLNDEARALDRLKTDIHGEEELRDAAQSQLDRVNELICRVREEVHKHGALAEPSHEDSFVEETKLVWSEHVDKAFVTAVHAELEALTHDMHRWPHASLLASKSPAAQISEPVVVFFRTGERGSDGKLLDTGEADQIVEVSFRMSENTTFENLIEASARCSSMPWLYAC